jgi:DNA-binding transcriptional regulator YhcF (GntR family)
MAPTVIIDRSSDHPVYGQIADQLRTQIATGALPSGTILPSVRRLAGDLGVNLNTIARAYRLLASERFLVIRDRVGVLVAAPSEEIGHVTRSKALEQLRMSLARLRQGGMAIEELLSVARREVFALRASERLDAD